MCYTYSFLWVISSITKIKIIIKVIKLIIKLDFLFKSPLNLFLLIFKNNEEYHIIMSLNQYTNQ